MIATSTEAVRASPWAPKENQRDRALAAVCIDIAELDAFDRTLRANIVSSVAAYLHPTSTVPIGADSDPTAVVDAWGKVRGIEALRVVDASILPDIPSVATNVTTIMVAERIAAKLSA